MIKEYPLRPHEKDTIVFDCECGHSELEHKATIIDILFKLDSKKLMFSGSCKTCMCPKFKQTTEEKERLP